jgi:hypothetical protein
LDEYSAREHLQVAGGDEAERRDRRQFRRVVSAYLIGIVVGLALPVLAVAMYLVISLYLVVPFREISRLLSQRA